MATPRHRGRWRPGLIAFGAVATALVGVYGATCASAPGDGASFVGGPPRAVLLAWGAKVDALVAGGELERLCIAPLLHVDLVHLATNLLWTLLFGTIAARLIGTPRAAATWVLAGAGGHLASFLASSGPSVGASGSVNGLAALLAIAVWRQRHTLPPGLRWRALATVAVLLLALLLGPLSIEGVDHAAHVGGVAVGLAAGALPDGRKTSAALAGSAVVLLAVSIGVRAARLALAP